MRKIIKGVLWTVLLIFLIRVFIFQTYKIESFTMASTLIPGDRVLVNKLSKGTRFPNSIFGLPGADRSYLDFFRIPYFRLPGFHDFQRDQVIAYNDPRVADKPIDRSPIKISRIIGLPGDTIVILNKELFVNRNEIQAPVTVRRLYRVVTGGEPVRFDFLSKFSLEEPELIADVGIYDFLLDSAAYQAIQELPIVKTIRLRKQYIGDSSSGYFPYSSFFFWNRDQYGPLIIPEKGIKVDLNLKNIDLYRVIIDIHEGNDLLVDFSGITINGIKSSTYTFKNNYYFVMDDNRDKPDDSRIVGFIPESRIIGICKRILFSGDSQFEYLGGSKLKRTLKPID